VHRNKERRLMTENGMVRPCCSPASTPSWRGGTEDKENAMSQKLNGEIAVIGIDIGKNSFHIVGQDRRGALVLRQKWSHGQVEACQPATVPHRHGGLHRGAPSQS
jgi:hypothetical protein